MFNDPKTIEFRELNLTRNLNTGSRLLAAKEMWRFNGEKYEITSVLYSVALLKVIDEVMTNALDASVGAGIEVTYEAGVISVKNYGKYITFDKIQAAFSTQNTSSNYNDEDDSVTGGLNGVGAKLTNVFSKSFRVEVCDGDRLYSQLFENTLLVINKPDIKIYNAQPFVKITFELDCDLLCNVDVGKKYDDWLAANGKLFEDLIVRRAHEMAAYINDSVTYNGVQINANFDVFLRRHKRFDDDKAVSICVGQNFKMKIGILVHEPILKSKRYDAAGFKHVTILNGVVLEEKNCIFAHFIKKITDFIKGRPEFKKFVPKEIKKAFPGKYFADHITIIVIGQYPRRHFEFKSQEKSAISLGKGAAAKFDIEFAVPETFCAQVWKHVVAIYPKIIVPKNKNLRILKAPLNEPAICVRKKQIGDHHFIVEGNSAATLIRKIVSGRKDLTFERNGFSCLKGVPINPIKNSIGLATGWMMNDKLSNNVEIQSIVNNLGLKYGTEGTGHYRKIVIATDQDLDGIGKICSLMICFFMLYFPHIIKGGHLYRYRTPIIRAKVNGERKNFYSEQEFELNGGGASGTYFKGLGCHGKKDIKEMIGNFHNDLIKISYDQAGEILMHRLYGLDTGVRKRELLEFNAENIRRYLNENNILMWEHFKYESITEQINNILRMTPNTIDGLVPCQRKVIAYMRSQSRKAMSKINVSSLAGSTKGKMNYNHGQESLENSIKLLAQTFEGANNFPLLLSVSDCNGNRHGGSKVTTAARYTTVAYNPPTDIYFPIEDDSLLELCEEEGEKYEPINYVPIVPRILTEHAKSVATGWNSNYAARDMYSIIKYVRLSIEMWPLTICPALNGHIQDAKKIIYRDGKEIGVGAYELNGNILRVIDLPPRLTGTKVIKHLKPEVLEGTVGDYNNGENIDIVIELKPNFREIMKTEKTYLDPIVEYFGLYKIYTKNMNFYANGRLREYKYVSEIFNEWFKARQLLYERRIEKKKIYLKNYWQLLECIYYFIRNDRGAIEGRKINEQIKILETTPIEFTNGEKHSGYLKFRREGISMNVRGGAAELLAAITTGADYGYILKLRKNQTSTEYVENYAKSVIKARDEYFAYLKVSWASLWIAELDQFERAYREGRQRKWSADEEDD